MSEPRQFFSERTYQQARELLERVGQGSRELEVMSPEEREQRLRASLARPGRPCMSESEIRELAREVEREEGQGCMSRVS